MQRYIVLQCYGHQEVFDECTFALLSLWRTYADDALMDGANIVIYTDKPALLAPLKEAGMPIIFEVIDADKIKLWRGAINFVHRVKIEVLLHFCAHYQGVVLYLDTDIVLQSKLTPIWQHIEAGGRYMHVQEGIVGSTQNPVFYKLNRFLASCQHPLVANQQLANKAMWNAGVLGFSTQSLPMLHDVLHFTDSIYPLYPKHIVEQFAFSIYMQQAGTVKAASPYILHYWNLKELRPLLRSFFVHTAKQSMLDVMQQSKAIQIAVLLQEKANFYQNRSVLHKIQKKKWAPTMPHWDALLQQL